MTSATTFSTSVEAQQAAALLDSYRFELGGHDARQWVSLWLEFYRPSWIRDAVVEALYQGRYKSVSVRQILEMWQRRAKPIRHVTHEFEAAVCREFGEVKISPAAMAALPHVQRRHQTLRGQSSRSQSLRGQSSHGQSSHGQPSARQFSTQQASAQQSSARQSLGIQSSRHQSPSPEVAKKLTYASASTVSFNLSERLTVPEADSLMSQPSDGSQSEPSTAERSQPQTSVYRSPNRTSNFAKRTAKKTKTSGGIDSGRRLDNTAWREFPNYTTPTYARPELDETLRLQRQFKENLYESDRAIQPFKPALPFSAQTLRLAKQQASAARGNASL